MPPEVERHGPLYMQIVDHYRSLIRSGELRPGDRLPSARQLTTEWRVAIATAARVWPTLAAEGLVVSTPGGAGGTVVAPSAGRAPRDRMLAVRRVGRIYPDGEHARIVAAELVDAPDNVADALGIPRGVRAIRRHRITYRGGTPISASTSWFAEDLATAAPDLLGTDWIRMGTPGYIEQRTGRVLTSGIDQVAAAAADADVAAELGIPEGAPVLIGRNWARDASGEVVEYGESATLAGQWQAYDYAIT